MKLLLRRIRVTLYDPAEAKGLASSLVFAGMGLFMPFSLGYLTEVE